MKAHRTRLSLEHGTRFATILCATMLLVAVLDAKAQSLRVLHDFGVTAGDGDSPYAGLIEDSDGNLYGTTSSGGAHGFGTVYRLSPTANGKYEEIILYSFKGGDTDGAFPHAPLYRDSAGSLYSTTVAGGIFAPVCNELESSSVGCGVVFKLTPGANGEWTETVLHRFTGADGGNSFAGLVRDAAGNFYGATLLGGSQGLGTVFELSLTSSGWKEKVLHSFTGNTDGAEPFTDCATLALDGSGNVYGSTYKGGAANAGIVFKLSPHVSGTWTEDILYTFRGGADGNGAFSGVILDKISNLYGTTSYGGSHNYGTVFELTAAKGYEESILHNFSLVDGAKAFPNALIFDLKGDLIGTTAYAAFKLTRGLTGWSETVLWQWDPAQDQNGNTLFVPLMMDAHGNFYGVTLWGGQAGSTTGGVAFELIP